MVVIRQRSITDSDVLKDVLQSSQIQLSFDETIGTDGGGDIEEDAPQSPWQTGVYQLRSKEGQPIEAETLTSPRKSTRIRKPNPKYANVAIVEEADAKEPKTLEEAFQNPKWTKAMEEEIAALKQNQT